MRSEKHQARLRQARVCGSCRSNLNYPVYRREHGAFPAWCRELPLLNTREFPHINYVWNETSQNEKKIWFFPVTFGNQGCNYCFCVFSLGRRHREGVAKFLFRSPQDT